MSINSRFNSFCKAQNKIAGLRAVNQNDLTSPSRTTMEDVKKMYSSAARKQGATAQDVFQRMDAKSLIEFYKSTGGK